MLMCDVMLGHRIDIILGIVSTFSKCRSMVDRLMNRYRNIRCHRDNLLMLKSYAMKHHIQYKQVEKAQHMQHIDTGKIGN